MKHTIIKFTLSLFLFSQLQFLVIAQEKKNNEVNIKVIDEYLTFFSTNNPGAVISVFKKGEIVFQKSYGMADASNKLPMNNEMIFGIGEITKSFTSLAILILEEKGKLSLDNNLHEFFPDFPDYGKKVLVRNLLNHTSGLYEYENKITTSGEVLNFLKQQNNFLFEPGTDWRYSNSDYVLLSLIIEKASGMSYKNFIRKNILNKLQMNNTYFADEIGNQNIAESHFKIDSNYLVKREMSTIYGEQGIYTNSNDFVKWDKALYTDILLSCEYLSKIFTVESQYYKNRISYYGYGWQIMERMGIRYYWHGGSKYGYSTMVFHLPHSQTTILIFTNRSDGYDFLKMAVMIAREFDKSIMYKL